MLHTDKTWICVHLDPFCYQNIQLNLFFSCVFIKLGNGWVVIRPWHDGLEVSYTLKHIHS